jgi:hypothetical protein
MKQIVFLTLALAAAGAGAQQVYRCGSSYSQQPCPGATVVDTSDRVSASDASRARAVAQSDAQRADAMEKARLAQEKQAPKAVVMGPKAAASAPVAKPPVKHAKGKKTEKTPEQFTAVVPGTGKKHK